MLKVGIIANPVSARDIRRIVSHAGNLPINDRANILLRILTGLALTGVEEVLIMPENGGIRTQLLRTIEREHRIGRHRLPMVTYLEMPVMDVETDKIANEVEAADGGLLRRCVGQAGEVYPVRALLGVLAPTSVSDAEVNAYVDAFEMPEIEEDEDAGPTHEFAELEIGKIRYTERSGEGVPVLLIHGFGGDLDNWLFNIDAIAEKAPVYALDLPGHGQSVKAVANPDLEMMVSAVVQLMDHLKLDKAHLAGHSMGGLVAAQTAISNPDRVASLSLICSAGLGDDINAEYIDGFVSAANRKELKPKLKHLFADEGLVSRSMVDDLLKYKRLDGVQAFLDALKDNLFSNGKQAVNVIAGLEALECPQQVIWGEADAVIPRAHANGITGATVTVVAGAGHMVQMEESSRVNELLKELL